MRRTGSAHESAGFCPSRPQSLHLVTFMAPWPNQSCPHPGCGEPIRDLLTEMVASADQATLEFRALLGQTPGGAITCPYCQQSVEYDTDGRSLVSSARVPFQYSRAKMERRARDYGSHKIPPDAAMTPEQWVAEEKLMPGGALHGYRYVEDGTP
jgi:hypothetical protein